MAQEKILKVIIFDLDGVLINSLPNMNSAIRQVNKSMKLRISFREYKKYLGLPFEKIMKKIGVKENIKKIKKNYQKYSKKNIHKIYIKKKLLSYLQKLSHLYKIAVFTSKDKSRSKQILKKYKIFNYVVSSDDVIKGKPNPEGLLKIKKKFKINSSQCIFFGDSIYDYKASISARILYAHVDWGYENLNNLKKKIIKKKKYGEIEKIINSIELNKLKVKKT